MKQIHRPLRLCFLSHRHLSTLAAPVFAEYADRVEIEVVDAHFQPALLAARAREKSGEVDAFVSAGSNAALLRQSVALPVATIDINGYDILLALRQARAHGVAGVGVVTYGETIEPLERVKELLNVEVMQRAYATPEQARDRVAELNGAGCQVIVGPSLVVEAARAIGLRGVLAYSQASVRAGLENGIEMARVARLESARSQQVSAVLHSLQEAVLAVDATHRIVAVNSAMQAVLGAPAAALHGRDLRDVAPELALGETLQGLPDEPGLVLQFAGRDWLAVRTPLREADRITAAVLALYDARRIAEADASLRSRRKGRRMPAARHRFHDLLGQSPSFRQAVRAARRYAVTELGVLITGESGTGKELLAQAMHNASPRANGPFLALNCSALPESLLESELFGYEEGAFTGSRRGGKPGLFETAHRGTVFLDEIGDMPLPLQTRLLRVLQEREVTRLGGHAPIPVDVRIVAATHQPLEAMVAERRFRGDLYYRLNLLRLWVPPLRERTGDIETLAIAALHRRLAQLQCGHDPRAIVQRLLPRLQAHGWPGNVRELENVCDRIAVLHAQAPSVEAVSLQDLLYDCPELAPAQPPMAARAVDDAATLRAVLAQWDGHRGRAAQALGISRATLWRKMRALGLG
ncbi:propionate catabolism operon regulatory protein PrpR [Hydrogenophaga sp. BPS33]|uniref:propionate catabolism operon regulatory protein PrpR n=1 Tax=Hydrogenophaga sp. BPS33 TaxID=2651974 RepID=UPI0013200712|nr:propionate catabolism operon regulatory protein PrpR [Hydrogenophaga sp. BPS33]QHE87605.1 propionate catabolism operon regulatory protein PrpR [Hydrogenophaga sp. BPS33]